LSAADQCQQLLEPGTFTSGELAATQTPLAVGYSMIATPRLLELRLGLTSSSRKN